jgi:acyl-CoA thioesterase I
MAKIRGRFDRIGYILLGMAVAFELLNGMRANQAIAQARAQSGSPRDSVVLVADSFSGDAGASVGGRTPSVVDVPQSTWDVAAFNLGGNFTAALVNDPGEPSPAAGLACAGNSNGAIVVSLGGQDKSAHGRRLTISAALCGDMPALGFYSVMPTQDADGVFDVFAHFTGLELISSDPGAADNGTLVLYENGVEIARSPYSGHFNPHEFHTLSYELDTANGVIFNVTLTGSQSDYSILTKRTGFGDAAIEFAAVAAFCEFGRDHLVKVRDFRLASTASDSDSTPVDAGGSISNSPDAHASVSPILVQTGQKIGFIGDSITAQGDAPAGYIRLAVAGLKAEGIAAVAIPAGRSGETSANMIGRVNPEVLRKGANWITISCGVNDVMGLSRGFGCDLESFKKNVAGMVKKAQGWNVRVVLFTATPLGEDLDNANNHKLAAYNDFIRSFATEHHLILADMNAAFTEVLHSKPEESQTYSPGARLLADGIHPNPTGQFLMAATLLKALGVPATDMPRVEVAMHASVAP